MNLEKILSAKVLLLLNVAIIITAELTGSLFFDYGIIHIIAFFFLLLGISRVFVHYNAFDQYLKPLTFGSVAALLLFSISHLLEYVSFGSTGEYSDALYIDVTNIYMTAMLVVAIAAQYFIHKRDKTPITMSFLILGFLASLTVTALCLLRKMEISIEPDEADVYIYSAFVIAISVFSASRMFKIGKAVSIMHSFAGYIAVAFVLIAASSLHYSLYELLEHAGVPEMQIIYINHFLFYAALSLMFLAFARLSKLGGIYPKVTQ
jgi:hypothetical protein